MGLRFQHLFEANSDVTLNQLSFEFLFAVDADKTKYLHFQSSKFESHDTKFDKSGVVELELF